MVIDFLGRGGGCGALVALVLSVKAVVTVGGYRRLVINSNNQYF